MKKTIEEIFRDIEYNTGKFPREHIQELIQRKEEAKPFLLDFMRNFSKNYKIAIEKENYFGHIYATYLLAEFNEKSFLEIFLQLLRLPNEIPYELYGDGITEDGSRILASVYDGNIDLIKTLIEDEKTGEFERGEGVEALNILVFSGVLNREDVIEYYNYLLSGGLKDRNMQVIATIICCLVDIYPDKSYDIIKKCFDKGEADTSIISLKEIQESLKLDKGIVISRSKADQHNKLITDTIETLECWACFEQHKERHNNLENLTSEELMKLVKRMEVETLIKVGRNDPCPCGSGKKFKKCCNK